MTCVTVSPSRSMDDANSAPSVDASSRRGWRSGLRSPSVVTPLIINLTPLSGKSARSG